jgi:small subunit ribosomal protein S16
VFTARSRTSWEKTAAVAVKIKLKRMGKIRAPFYRIIVADARTKRDGRAIEEIGKYDPKSEPSYIEVNSERAQHWLSVGAQPTDPVRKLLEITGDWQKFKGLPGTEGTLKTAAAKTDKKEAFAAAVAENLRATDAKPDKSKARKPAATDTAKAKDTKAASAKTAKTDGKRAGGKSAKAADAPAEDGAASASAAAQDATASAEDSTAPAEDSAAPAEGSAAPAEDGAAPAEDTAAPAEDTASAGDKQDSEA